MMYKRRWFLRLEEFRLLIARSVATIAAMKSGLKGSGQMGLLLPVFVATIAAMKSGLQKTESLIVCADSFRCANVATIAAMKSGLKVPGQPYSTEKRTSHVE